MMRFRSLVSCLVVLAITASCGPMPEDDAGDGLERIEQAAEPVTASAIMAEGAKILVKKLYEKAIDKILAAIFDATDKETVTDVVPILLRMETRFAAEAAHVNWLRIRDRSESSLTAALTAVTEGRRILEQGSLPQQASTSDFKSANAWGAFVTDTLFQRPPDRLVCTKTSLVGANPEPSLWPCIITARATPLGPAGYTYDHRLTSEVMLRVVALRLAYIGMMAPDFVRSGFFRQEILDMRSMLLKHRKTVVDGTVCAHKDLFLLASSKYQPTPNSPQERFIACADLHTGKGLVRKQQQPYPGAPFDEAATASVKGQLRAELLGQTPIQALDSIVADLAWFADPDVLTRLTTAQSSSDVHPAFPVAHAVDGNPSTAYSSAIFPSQQNTRSTFIAAWTGLTTAVEVNQLRITPRMWNGAIQAFPQRYHVWVTAADNSHWVFTGTFTTQPDRRGTARVDLGATFRTFGVYLLPDLLGKDSFGGHYFQIGDLSLAKAY